MKESQVWRYASGGQAIKRLTLYHDFIPELIDLQPFLNSHFLCEKHYNQVIYTDHFYQQLSGDYALRHQLQMILILLCLIMKKFFSMINYVC